jgi:hypothetical protein
MEQTVLVTLEKRLRILDFIEKTPEIREEQIERPVFVIGLPRTGTTLLFNLLAQDPAARPLLSWESFHPVPPKKSVFHRPGQRLREHRRWMRSMERRIPELKTIHDMRADGPEECLPLLRRSFCSPAWLLFARLEGYDSWLWQQGDSVHEDAYRFHRQQLQLLQWQGEKGRWLLKSPAHVEAVRFLLSVYPDAIVIRLHRDLYKVIASNCSLMMAIRGHFYADNNPALLGQGVVAVGGQMIRRLLKTEEGGRDHRIIDVNYADLTADPEGVVNMIYRRSDLNIGPEMARGMQRWIAENPRHKHGPHSYSMEDYGIETNCLESEIAAYHEHFQVPREN